MKIIKNEKHIEIIEQGYRVELYKEDEKYKLKFWKINWSAYGSVGVNETKIYIKLLQKAIELAKQ